MSGQQPKGKVIMESISCREAAARLVLGASGVKEMHSVSGVRNGSVTLMAARRRVGRRKGKGGAAGRSGPNSVDEWAQCWCNACDEGYAAGVRAQ